MIEEYLTKNLFDRIKPNAKVAIFGAGTVGKGIFEDIKTLRPDVKIICFIDSHLEGSVQDVKIINIKDIDETISQIDTLICSIRHDGQEIAHCIFKYYPNIDFIENTRFIERYYRDEEKLLSDKNLELTLKIFKDKKYKELWREVFAARAFIDEKNMSEYANTAHNIRPCVFRMNIYHHYLDEIVKDKVKVIYDAGFYDGRNVLAFDKLLLNLEKIYAFEPIYDITSHPFFDKFIKNLGKVEIINCALGEKTGEAEFLLHDTKPEASAVKELTTKRSCTVSAHFNTIKRKVKVTSIDDYSRKNILPPDLIKMDIEGAELSAIKGAIATIKRYRPQLAISIYHSDSDFIKIPLYLYENLDNYSFRVGHYSYGRGETVFYAIPEEKL